MNEIIEKAITHLGTQEKLAHACGVSQAAIHKWLRGKSHPSAINAKKIEMATNGVISRSDIRPDIFN